MTDPTAPSSTTGVGDEFVGPFPSWVNIKAYGAKGDGITDDTAAFQRALADLGTPGHGNVLWIPAGTYKITSQLNLSGRLGVSIIGEDPATTILKWAGPGVFSTDSTSGSMFVVNGVSESRFDRLTFDGSGSPITLVDQVWDGASNYFPSGNEFADDNFQNANIGFRSGVSGGGTADTSILRDHFTNLGVIGVIPMNYNALNIWVRDSVFDHDMNGVGDSVFNPDGSTYINGSGDVSVYNSIFRYSTMNDISIGNTAPFAIRDNYSIGSGRFFFAAANNSASNTILQGNTILDTTDPISVFGGSAGPYVMIDNVIRSNSTVTQGPVVSLSDFAGDTDLTAIGNQFTVPSPIYTSGRLVALDNSIVSPSTISSSEPTLPSNEPNMGNPVIEVAVGSSDMEIQQAINSAVAQYNGQRPVVHIPAGTYYLANTVTIPANTDVQLVGDGMFATVLQGNGSGPAVQIQGPSHATLRDIGLNGDQTGDALDVSNIDQPGSRVFISQALMSGATNANLFFDGLDYTTVDAENIQYSGEQGGADIRVVGGPLAAAGNPQGGALNIFSSSGGGDYSYTSNIDVSNGGTLLSRDVFFDGGPPPYLRVTQGTATIDNGHVWMNLTDYPQSAPAVDLSNLNGKVTLLNTDIGNSTVISGDGTNAQVLGLGVFRNQPAPTGSYFYNNASPAATAGLLNSRQWNTIIPGMATVPTPDQGTIDSTFVTSMVAQARGDQPPLLTPLADGVSDVRLYRVLADNSSNNILLYGLTPNPPPPAPNPSPPAPNPSPPAGTTADMILRGSNTSSAAVAGQYEIYDIGNNSILAAYSLGQVGTDWAFVTLGRFFGSDTTDMLLRNTNTGAFEVYDISNNNITKAAALGTVGLDWQVAGFADFNRDGMTDMMLRNSNTGAIEIYNINNNSIINATASGAVGLNWQVGGFGNFSSVPGETDMIMRNISTGGLVVYFDDNHSLGAAFMGTVGVDWQIIGVGNFSSVPGETDMIMRNSTTGGLEVYNIANNQITGAAFLGTVGLDWQFAGIAPVHGPDASDLVLHNVNSGAFEVYDIAKDQITGAAPLGSVGLEWQLGGLAADPPTGSMGGSDREPHSTSQLVQAMAGFGGGSGTADGLNTVPLGSDTSQQPLLTTPQHA
jgi:hypothetical protein